MPERYEQFLGKYQRIVGYFGALAPWLWYEVLNELAERLPDHGFVYLGPDYYGGIEKLSKRDNVLWLGAIDYAVLPAYAQRFDIAIIPFEPGEIARTTSPLKLFEYFALEVPVVVTSAMDECTCYPEVFSAASLEEYLEQIERAFSVKDDVQYRARMRELADENDWSARAEKMAPLFPAK
ncbi:glycosyltransferase [Alcaligenes faecalis]|uniref:glycosyltransferase n=1 Tax=Alcaligenes faecalis TaxID=511 RepID=UPI0024BCADE6|nr:glycosyltransferase [Alcaligenes faecalis]